MSSAVSLSETERAELTPACEQPSRARRRCAARAVDPAAGARRQAERHGFEYFRHGTLSLYAAFNTKTGEVLGKTTPRHTSAEFVAFLTDIVANQPRGKEIHVIADNLSAHKTELVEQFLERFATCAFISHRPTRPG